MISEELRQRIATLTGIDLDPLDFPEQEAPMMVEPMAPTQVPGMDPAERERLMMILQMMGGQS